MATVVNARDVQIPLTQPRLEVVSLSSNVQVDQSNVTGLGLVVEGTKQIYLAATSQIFQIPKTGSISPASITITAYTKNLVNTPTFTLAAGSMSVTPALTAGSFTFNASQLTTDVVTFRLTLVEDSKTYTDDLTVCKVREGADAINGLLTNESHTLPADSAGNVTSHLGAGGQFKVYQGINDVTSVCTFSIPAGGNPDSLTYSLTASGSSAGTFAVTANYPVAKSLTILTIRATFGTLTLDKIFTLSKASAGAAGSNGTNGTNGIRGSKSFYVPLSGSTNTFSDALATTTASIDGGPVRNDTVQQYNNSMGFTQTKFWDGSSWLVVNAVVDGNLLVTGTVGANAIAANSITGDKIVAGSITADDIDSRGLSIKDSSGNIILAAGTALQTAYAPAGTLNSEVAVGDNLIRKFDFSTAGVGGWNGGATNEGGTSAIGLKEIFVRARDTMEADNQIPVIPGERIYGGAFIWTGGTARQVTIGMYFINSSGSPFAFEHVGSYRPPGQAGGWLRGSFVVPAGAVKAYPWIQMDAFDNFGYAAISGIYLSRTEPGATYGAPAGTYVGSTLAQTVESNASTALASVQAFASDNVLSRGEKPQMIMLWNDIEQGLSSITQSANNYGIVSERNSYTSAVDNLAAYLNGLAPAWNDTNTDTNIVGTTLRSYWAAVDSSYAVLVAKISEIAGQRASWSGVSGTGKPADNATVGAQAGVNLKDSAGSTLVDAAIKNSAISSGVNLLFNADFDNNLEGWYFNGSYGLSPASCDKGVNLNSNWRLAPAGAAGTSVMWISQGPRVGDDSYYWQYLSTPVPVTPGKNYAISGYTGAHRCRLLLFYFLFDSAGNVVGHGHSSDSLQANDEEKLGGTTLEGYKRCYHNRVIPADCAYIRVALRKYDTKAGQSDSFAFITRVQVEEVGADAMLPGPWVPCGLIDQTTVRVQNPITTSNVSTYIANLAIGSAQVSNVLQSDNYVPDVSGWMLRKSDGYLEAGNAKFRGSIRGGAYNGWAWPASGGTGYYLGPEGLLLGSYHDNKYLQVSSDGNMYMPGMQIENSVLTISQVDVIDTVNIRGQAVSLTSSAYTDSESTWSSLATDTWQTVQELSVNVATNGKVVVMAGCCVFANVIGVKTSGGTVWAEATTRMRVLRDGVEISSSEGPFARETDTASSGYVSASATSSGTLNIVPYTDTSVAAGTHTYTLQATATARQTSGDAITFVINTLKVKKRGIVLMELKK